MFLLIRSLVKTVAHRVHTFDCWLIFAGCSLVYFLNERTIATGDSVPNSLLVLNWFFNDRLDFDNFRNSYLYTNGQIPWFFVEAKHQHLSSLYPIGTAIVSLPIYACFYLFLIAQGAQIDLASADFNAQRLFFEKISATILTALSVVIFYQISRIKFDRSVSLITAFIFAFATQTWMISSQGLWQHTATNLVLLCTLLCLAKANLSQGLKRKLLILNAGIFCGLLLSIRPTNIFFVIPIVLTSLFYYRRDSILLLSALPALLPSLLWNLYYFGNLGGAYSAILSAFTFSPQSIAVRLVGLLFSPSRGLFVYSPVLLFVGFGFFSLCRFWKHRNEKLLLCLIPSCLALLIQYACFEIWWGGGSFGPRLLTDSLAVLCLMLNYAIARHLNRFSSLKRFFIDWRTLLFSLLLVFSVFVQTVGAFGTQTWNGIPLDIDANSTQFPSSRRLWQISDTEIERTSHSVFVQVTQPTRQPTYAAGLRGRILQILDRDQQPIRGSILAKPGTAMILRATVQNTGSSRWLGYETGASQNGEMRIRVLTLDPNGQTVGTHALFISGQPRTQQIADAVGGMVTPSHPGLYRLRFSLYAEGVGEVDQADAKRDPNALELTMIIRD
jgi:hypothetical protein